MKTVFVHWHEKSKLIWWIWNLHKNIAYVTEMWRTPSKECHQMHNPNGIFSNEYDDFHNLAESDDLCNHSFVVVAVVNLWVASVDFCFRYFFCRNFSTEFVFDFGLSVSRACTQTLHSNCNKNWLSQQLWLAVKFGLILIDLLMRWQWCNLWFAWH